MPLQRTRDAENRVRNNLSNGPLRVQGNGFFRSILQRVGIREFPGVCWYPAKRHSLLAMNQGGTADRDVYSSLAKTIFFAGDFLYLPRHKSLRCSANLLA